MIIVVLRVLFWVAPQALHHGVAWVETLCSRCGIVSSYMWFYSVYCAHSSVVNVNSLRATVGDKLLFTRGGQRLCYIVHRRNFGLSVLVNAISVIVKIGSFCYLVLCFIMVIWDWRRGDNVYSEEREGVYKRILFWPITYALFGNSLSKTVGDVVNLPAWKDGHYEMFNYPTLKFWYLIIACCLKRAGMTVGIIKLFLNWSFLIGLLVLRLRYYLVCLPILHRMVLWFRFIRFFGVHFLGTYLDTSFMLLNFSCWEVVIMKIVIA